jgi:arsenite methyltransferase
MSHTTSTGHAVSDAPWLDAHFQAALPEYEYALRFVGIQAGWTVLDAGCGSGGYVPMICDQTGPTGRVSALDLAPENVAQVEGLMR